MDGGRSADEVVQEGKLKAWAPEALQRVASQIVVRGIDVNDLPWAEIDFPRDVHYARTQVWPAVADEYERLRGGGGTNHVSSRLFPEYFAANNDLVRRRSVG